MQEQLLVGGQTIDLNCSRINLLFNTDSVGKTEFKDRLTIGPEQTIQQFEHLQKIDRYTAVIFRYVFPDFHKPVVKENIECFSHRHIVGLFSLTFHAIANNQKFFWSFPDNGLHPKNQVVLGDIVMLLSDVNLINNFLLKVNHHFFDDLLIGLPNNDRDCDLLFS